MACPDCLRLAADSALSGAAAARRYRGSADAVRRNLPVVLEPYRGT